MSEQELDRLFDFFDDLLLAGHFDECSMLLDKVSLGEKSPAELLTILTATAAARDKLPARGGLFSRVRAELVQRGEDADALLSGLE